MQLLRALREVGRAIHVMASDLLSHEAARAHKLEQRLLDGGLEFTGQFRGQTPAIGARDKLLCRVTESAEARKVRTPAGPQSPLVKLGQGIQRVELAAVRIAGVVRKFLQLAKDSSTAVPKAVFISCIVTIRRRRNSGSSVSAS